MKDMLILIAAVLAYAKDDDDLHATIDYLSCELRCDTLYQDGIKIWLFDYKVMEGTYIRSMDDLKNFYVTLSKKIEDQIEELKKKTPGEKLPPGTPDPRD